MPGNTAGTSSVSARSQICPRWRLATWKVGKNNWGKTTLLLHVAEPLYGARLQVCLADTDRETEERARGAYRAYSAT